MTGLNKTLGGFEVVSFPELGVKDVIAKVDTGAYSGALHASHVREFVDEQGNKTLEFYPLGKKQLKSVTTQYRRKQIKSSNGQFETRFVIKTKLTIKDKDHMINISLSDRAAMMKSVLLGRQFLRRHHFIVDVRQGTEYRHAGKDSELRA